VIFVRAVLLLMYCLDSSVADDVGISCGRAASSTVKTVDGDQPKEMKSGQMLSNTLLSGSATEFDLQCETDSGAESPTKRRRSERTTTIVSRSVDSLSGGILVTATASSCNSGEDITDISAMLKTGSAGGNEASSEKVLPVLKQRRSYSAKASRKLCVFVSVRVMSQALGSMM